MEFPKSEKHVADRYANWIAGLLVLVILVDLAVIIYRKCQRHSLEIHPHAVDFKFQFDPNTAQVEELEYLPGLNRKLAAAIVAYREEIHRHFPDRVVFQKRQELTRVKGISEKTLLKIGAFLIFPDEDRLPGAP